MILSRKFETIHYLLVMVLVSMIGENHLQAQDIVINEILASNQSGITDEDEDTSDWIELYNAGTETIDLLGYGITDDSTEWNKWIFPSVIMKPNTYFLIWASGKDRKDSMVLHTNFRLSAAGEYLGLFTPGNTKMDDFTYGSQTADVSYGRFPDGNDTFLFFQYPTPAAANEETVNLSVSMPSGMYNGSVTVELETDADEGEIYFTLGGDEPDEEDSRYTAPLIFTGTTILRARVYVDNTARTAIETRSYLVDEDPQLPVVSLVTTWHNLWGSKTGIYTNPNEKGRDWEKPGHIEYIKDGITEFSIPAGIRIHGGNSRDLLKKNFRIYFRDEYGVKALHYPLFPIRPYSMFKRFILYAPSSDQTTGSWHFTHITDALTHSIWFTLNGNISAFKPISLYLNGDYWGLYWIREYIDRNYVESGFGVTDMDLHQDDWYLWKLNVKEGDSEFWLETLDFFEFTDLSDPENYRLAKENYVEIDHFTDYYIINIFAGNKSWPHGNTYRYRDRAGDPRWRWIMWDTDSAWRWVLPTGNILKWATRDAVDPGYPNDNYGWLWSTQIIRGLLRNDEYRTYFINRFADLMNTTLLPDSIMSHIDRLCEMIRPEMEREMDRWGPLNPWYVQNVTNWEENVEELRTVIRQRPGFQREHIMEKFGLDDTSNVTILPSIGNGSVRVNTITPDDLPWEGTYYHGVPIEISATPSAGYVFYQWSDTTLPNLPGITVTLEGNRSFQAIFYQVFQIEKILIESTTDSSAIISWSTSEPVYSRILYGLSETLEFDIEVTSECAEIHCITLEDLIPDTLYYFQIVCTDSAGLQGESDLLTFRTLEESSGTQILTEKIPDQFKLSPGYPNPFNSIIHWEVALPEQGQLHAAVYNVSGQRVTLLYDGYRSAGLKRMDWNGRNTMGEIPVSGVYILRVLFDGQSGRREQATTRMVMIR